MGAMQREGGRDTSRDGFRNKLESFVLTRGRPIWALVNRVSWLRRIVNRLIVENAVGKAPFRPLALSTMAAYPSWSSLTDRTWFARYLPPRDIPDLPSVDALSALYETRPDGPRLSDRSTLLFPAFAQWFTDGFLMTSSSDTRRTFTNHQIDLSQLYGMTEDAQHALRCRSPDPGRRGRLLSEIADGEEWPPRLFLATGERDPRFLSLPLPIKMPDSLPTARRSTLFAFGGERANSTVYTAALNVLFLREHNRLCALLEIENPAWDDQRIFETARAINIVQLIKIVVEEYINHISPYWFRLLGEPSPSYHADWNRENWIPVEFNLLYRWHSLVPETVVWRGREVSLADARFNNAPMLADGLHTALDSASTSKAWRMGLFNTAEMLRPVERASIGQGRTNPLASYNDYRERMRYPRITRFEQISGDPTVVNALRKLYGDVDRIELFVGLFAEDIPNRSAVPPLIGRMVALDAFSHALTNPLMSPLVFNEATFSKEGWASLARTSCLMDLAERNRPESAPASFRVCMEVEGYNSVA